MSEMKIKVIKVINNEEYGELSDDILDETFIVLEKYDHGVVVNFRGTDTLVLNEEFEVIDEPTIDDELHERLSKFKKEDLNEKFNESYQKYQEEIELYTGGFVQSNKADFVKMCAFFNSVAAPVIEEYITNLK